MIDLFIHLFDLFLADFRKIRIFRILLIFRFLSDFLIFLAFIQQSVGLHSSESFLSNELMGTKQLLSSSFNGELMPLQQAAKSKFKNKKYKGLQSTGSLRKRHETHGTLTTGTPESSLLNKSYEQNRLSGSLLLNPQSKFLFNSNNSNELSENMYPKEANNSSQASRNSNEALFYNYVTPDPIFESPEINQQYFAPQNYPLGGEQGGQKGILKHKNSSFNGQIENSLVQQLQPNSKSGKLKKNIRLRNRMMGVKPKSSKNVSFMLSNEQQGPASKHKHSFHLGGKSGGEEYRRFQRRERSSIENMNFSNKGRDQKVLPVAKERPTNPDHPLKDRKGKATRRGAKRKEEWTKGEDWVGQNKRRKPKKERKSKRNFMRIFDSKEFDIDLKKVKEDRRTTLMIKNIPNKYTQDMLLYDIDGQFENTYDFFYVPIDLDVRKSSKIDSKNGKNDEKVKKPFKFYFYFLTFLAVF